MIIKNGFKLIFDIERLPKEVEINEEIVVKFVVYRIINHILYSKILK